MTLANAQTQELQKYGQSLVGKTAQSRIFKEITDGGGWRYADAAPITGFEIVEEFQEPSLMLVISGESVFEDTLFNIS